MRHNCDGYDHCVGIWSCEHYYACRDDGSPVGAKREEDTYKLWADEIRQAQVDTEGRNR